MNLKEKALHALKSDKEIVESGADLELLANLVVPTGNFPTDATASELASYEAQLRELQKEVEEKWNEAEYITGVKYFINTVQKARRESKDISWLDEVPQGEKIFANVK